MENNFIIRKVDVKNLIDSLVELWNAGVNYVDLQGMPGDVMDRVLLGVKQEYRRGSREDEEKYYSTDGGAPLDEKPERLTDDDINQLLNDDE